MLVTLFWMVTLVKPVQLTLVRRSCTILRRFKGTKPTKHPGIYYCFYRGKLNIKFNR